MKKQTVKNYYTFRKKRLLKDFDKTAKHWRKVMVSYYGDDFTSTTVREARQEFEALIPKLPMLGVVLKEEFIFTVMCLALYRVFKKHGKTAEEVGKIVYEAEEARYAAWPKLLRRFVGWGQFTKYAKNYWKKTAAESQKRRYPEDCVFIFVEGDGKEFDYGLDMTECAVCKFFHAQGADEFTPYMCLLDFVRSKALGMGLVRTMTIAEGGGKCDFRWKRGRETRRGWPPEFLKRNES